MQKRLELYENVTSPLKEFYTELGIFTEFKGTETNVIWPEMVKYLEEFFNGRKDNIIQA